MHWTYALQRALDMHGACSTCTSTCVVRVYVGTRHMHVTCRGNCEKATTGAAEATEATGAASVRVCTCMQVHIRTHVCMACGSDAAEVASVSVPSVARGCRLCSAARPCTRSLLVVDTQSKCRTRSHNTCEYSHRSVACLLVP